MVVVVATAVVRRTLTTIVAFAALAHGGPLSLFGTRNPKGKCDVGKIQCCQNVSTPNSPEVMSLATNPTLLNLLTSLPVNAPIGMSCTNAGAGSGVGCDSNPICCDNPSYQSGLINVGCSPIDMSDLL